MARLPSRHVAAVRGRVESAREVRRVEVRLYLGEAGVASTDWMLERLQALHRSGRREPEQERNRDLFPRDEFDSPP